jgi:ABC-type antimicrobial peptide transport system permease subunit
MTDDEELEAMDSISTNKKPAKDRRITHEKFGAFAYIISNLTRHRLRTTLTIIGIAVPIAFFILFAALGDGLDQYIESQSKTIRLESYKEMQRIVNAWTDVLLVIIAIMIVTSIANTMLMSTSERKFEFGVLKAIGIRQEQIVTLVLAEALIISIIALIVGIIIGIWSAIVFDHLFWAGSGDWIIFAPAKVSTNAIVIATVLTVIIGSITALYPAFSVSRQNTIDILRYE